MKYTVYMAPRRTISRMTLQADREVFEAILEEIKVRNRRSVSARNLAQALEGKPDGMIQLDLPTDTAHMILEIAGVNY